MKYGIHTYMKNILFCREKIMKNISVPKKYDVILLIILCILAVSGVAYSGNIIIKPGKFDHFAIQIPEKEQGRRRGLW